MLTFISSRTLIDELLHALFFNKQSERLKLKVDLCVSSRSVQLNQLLQRTENLIGQKKVIGAHILIKQNRVIEKNGTHFVSTQLRSAKYQSKETESQVYSISNGHVVWS